MSKDLTPLEQIKNYRQKVLELTKNMTWEERLEAADILHDCGFALTKRELDTMERQLDKNQKLLDEIQNRANQRSNNRNPGRVVPGKLLG